MAKPIADSSDASTIGVLPPTAMLTICGTARSWGMRRISSRLSGASTNVMSAPAWSDGDDQQVRTGARIDGGANFSEHLSNGNDFFAREVAATLRRNLIFNLDGVRS